MLNLILSIISKINTLASKSSVDNIVNNSIKSNLLSVNTDADSINKVALKADNVLIASESGDQRTTVNKNTTNNTASFQFKNNYSGRAEFGLIGSDDFSLKVSPDGSAFNESFKVAKETGDIDFKQKLQKKGVDVATIDQINLIITSVIETLQTKPTTDGLYVFKVVPSDGLPVGINLGDIAKLSSGSWSSLFTNLTGPNVINVGINKIAYFKENGTYSSLGEKFSSIPVGTIQSFLGYAAPTNWVLCNGTTLQKNSYPELWAFAVINNLTTTNATLKTKFFDIDSNNFKTPDLRGYFIRGRDETGVIDVDGVSRGNLDVQLDSFQGHFHNTRDTRDNTIHSILLDYNPGSGSGSAGSNRSWGHVAEPITDGTHGTPRTSFETRSINIATTYIIKAKNSISNQQFLAGDNITLKTDSNNNAISINSNVAIFYKYGLITSHNTTTPLTSIDIAPGQARSTYNDYDIRLYSTLTKNIANTWTSGNNNGGRFTGVSLTNGTWYDLFLISDGVNVDAGFDYNTDLNNASHKPNGYTYYRRVASVYYVDSSTGFFRYKQIDDDTFLYASSIKDLDNSPGYTVTKRLTVPVGRPVKSLLQLDVQPMGSSGFFGYNVYNPYFGAGLVVYTAANTVDASHSSCGEIWTDTDGNIVHGYVGGSGVVAPYLYTRGYIDNFKADLKMSSISIPNTQNIIEPIKNNSNQLVPYSICQSTVDSNGNPSFITKIDNNTISFDFSRPLIVCYPDGSTETCYSSSNLIGVSGMTGDGTYTIIKEKGIVQALGNTYDGSYQLTLTEGKVAPTSPVNGDYFLDTSVIPNIPYKRILGSWIATQFVKLGYFTKSGGTFNTIICFSIGDEDNRGTTMNYSKGWVVAYNTVYKAPSNGFINILMFGSYMNSLYLYYGLTNNPTDVQAQFGDDINSNTKASSICVPIKKGTYFKVATGIVGASGGGGFETTLTRFYPMGF